MKKSLTIFLISLISLVFCFFISEYTIFKKQSYKNADNNKPSFYNFKINNPNILKWRDEDITESRAIFGKYYQKSPIILFGGSYAYGHYLEDEETFGYKLSQIIKRPVYNRAICGGGFQHMYEQTESDSFYKSVPKSNNVIYIMINDHCRRMLGETFTIFDNYLNLHYSVKNNSLVIDNYKNPIVNFFKFSYTFRYLRFLFKNSYIYNPKNAEKITNDILLYFIKTRENLENHWQNKINFYIILYEDVNIPFADILKKKFEDNNFIVIRTKNLTDVDLSSEEYKMQDNMHPKQSAWNLLTPKIVKELNIKD